MKKFLKVFIGLVFIFSIFSCSKESTSLVLNDVFYTSQNPEEYSWDFSKLERVTELKWGEKYYIVCSYSDPNLEAANLKCEYGLYGQRQTVDYGINALYEEQMSCWNDISWTKGGNDSETEVLLFYLEDVQGRCSNSISYTIYLSY